MFVIGGQEKIRALCRGTISNNGDALDLCGLTEPNVERMELAAKEQRDVLRHQILRTLWY